MFGWFGFVSEVQNGPGEEHGNQEDNGATKQQNEQVAKFSSGMTLNLTRAEESEHCKGQSPESRLGQ